MTSLVWISAAFIVGIFITEITAHDLGQEDPGGIVWDEFVGMWLTLVAVPPGYVGVILAFVLFRIFDAVKKGPVGLCDRHVKGGFGIMFDDVVTALMAWLVLQLTYFAAPQFFVF